MHILFLEEYLQELLPFPYCLCIHKVQMGLGNFNTDNEAIQSWTLIGNTQSQNTDTGEDCSYWLESA